MSLISSTIPNFVNGISQQPFTLRLTSQGQYQENALSTVSSGLRKRPPTEHLAKISSTPLTDAFIHSIDRDSTEQYQVIITNGDLAVYDLAGNAKVVNFTDKAYLNTTVAVSDSFAATTVADYSFIVNKTKATAAGTTLTPTRPFEALFNVKLGNYGKSYVILVNGTAIATFTTPDGSVSAQAIQISTDTIAANLGTSMATAGYNTAPWSSSVSGSTIHLVNTSVDFSVACKDGFNGFAMVAIKDRLQRFSDLPLTPGVPGFQVEIVGEASSSFNSYWVQFVSKGGDGGIGVWRETVAPGIKQSLAAETMPHLLVREADGTFTFKPATWANRLVGNLKSSPDPSFIGQAVNDIFFFQNRLGFLSDENFIQSETGKYFNMFRTTVVTLLDSDPLDVTAATNKVAILKHAVSFNKQLLLFSAQQQFMVDGSDLMTPKKVPIKPTTDFLCNTKARPVAIGRNVYFTIDRGNWSSVKEYFVDVNNATNDASDVTSHVPMYIPAGIVKIAAGSNEDVLVMLSERDRTKLYVYKYYFSGNEKLQSSWSHFSFGVGGTILSCDFIKSSLYLVVSRADGVYFEKMDFSVGASTVGEPYRVHLDRKVQVPVGSLSFDGINTIITGLPYTLTDGVYMGVSKGGGEVKAGQLFNVNVSGGVPSILGNVTASALTVGKQYLFRYVISPLVVRIGAQGQAKIADTDGRTQVRRIAFNHSDTGYYRAVVTPTARQSYTYVFSGQVLGTPSATIGTEALATGRLIAPVMSSNRTVEIAMESELPLPVAIFSADWEAFYVKRSRPI